MKLIILMINNQQDVPIDEMRILYCLVFENYTIITYNFNNIN